MSALSEFWSASIIWRDPLVASVLAGALLGFLGVYVVLRRVVFVSAALTQLSTLGVIASLLVLEHLDLETDHQEIQLFVAWVFSVGGGLVLGTLGLGKRLPTEAGVGMAYVLAGALVILGANRLVHVAHDLNTMVFGNAVAVPFQDVVILLVVTGVVALLHTLFRKEIVFASFDRETAEAMGVKVRLWGGRALLHHRPRHPGGRPRRRGAPGLRLPHRPGCRGAARHPQAHGRLRHGDGARGGRRRGRVRGLLGPPGAHGGHHGGGRRRACPPGLALEAIAGLESRRAWRKRLTGARLAHR